MNIKHQYISIRREKNSTIRILQTIFPRKIPFSHSPSPPWVPLDREFSLFQRNAVSQFSLKCTRLIRKQINAMVNRDSCGPSKTLLNKPSLYRQLYGDEPTKKFQSKTKSQIMAFFYLKKTI